MGFYDTEITKNMYTFQTDERSKCKNEAMRVLEDMDRTPL